MSAQIPETMLMSDLLKSTGYECPEDLQGKTFAEATAGGDVQTNRASTIDVSAYTEPVVIEPDTDYESMKKNTVTLSNIPQAKTEITLEATENKTYTPEEGKVYNSVVVNVPAPTVKLYAWKSNSDIVYTKVAEPTTSDKALVPASTGLAEAVIAAVGESFASITISTDEYARYSTGDITVA